MILRIFNATDSKIQHSHLSQTLKSHPRLLLLPRSSDIVTRQSCLQNTSPICSSSPIPGVQAFMHSHPNPCTSLLAGLPVASWLPLIHSPPCNQGLFLPCTPKPPGTWQTLPGVQDFLACPHGIVASFNRMDGSPGRISLHTHTAEFLCVIPCWDDLLPLCYFSHTMSYPQSHNPWNWVCTLWYSGVHC